MKKIQFTGTIETFYFVPNCEEEGAILYLNVTSERKYPNGPEKTFIPPKNMRFVLTIHEAGILATGRAVASGDKMSINAVEDANGKVSYYIDKIEPKIKIIDAED